MIYTIEIQADTGHTRALTLKAKTMRGAERACRAWIRSNLIPAGYHVYLTFDRSSDGQHGYINPGAGADITGRPWPKGRS